MGDLIDPIRKCWNRELVTEFFFPFEVDRVLSIPISSRLPEDTLCWDLEKDGCYSVWSAYKALWGDINAESEGSPSYAMDMWPKIWIANVLPRVKVFAWRAVSNALPTRQALGRRISGYNAVCGVCGREEENVLYALLRCPLAEGVWSLSSFQVRSGMVGGTVGDW